MNLRWPDRRIWAGVFFIMSPLFPGNNWLEVSVIGAAAGALGRLLPWTVNHGLLRAALYTVYNTAGLAGYFLLRTERTALRRADALEFSAAVALLALTGLVPEPWATVILAAAGVYFLRRPLTVFFTKLRGDVR